MKRKLLSYALTFATGSFLSGGVAMAATNYVQAQKGTSAIQLNGKTLSQPPKLVYGGTTYVQLYPIQNGLQQVLGVRPTWDGTNLDVLTSAQSPSSGATGDFYTTYPSSAEISFSRAGQHPELLLESAINQAHSTLDVAIYSITKSDIVDSIVSAKNRGVNVRVITDKTEAGNSYQKAALTTLSNAGIPIKENSHSGLMHMKVSIIDNTEVATGSYNYSTAASTTNDENLVILHDSQATQDYKTQFNRMWNDTSGFQNWN